MKLPLFFFFQILASHHHHSSFHAECSIPFANSFRLILELLFIYTRTNVFSCESTKLIVNVAVAFNGSNTYKRVEIPFRSGSIVFQKKPVLCLVVAFTVVWLNYQNNNNINSSSSKKNRQINRVYLYA